MVAPKLPRVVGTVVIIACILMLGLGWGQGVIASPRAQSTGIDYDWRLPVPPNQPIVISPSAETNFVITGFTLRNNASITNTYELAITALPRGWRADLSTTQVTLSPSDQTGSLNSSITVRLVIPAGAQTGNQSITVSAFRMSGGNRAVQADVFVPLNVIVGTPVPTAELAPGCPEVSDPGNNFDSAQLLRVDLEEAHGICSKGDEDWFKFGGVAGKIYTIDISQMDVGLDLSLELYDERRIKLTSNDDFYNRNPSAPNPFDKRPRIQSWRAPANGLYTVRVRDTLGIGGKDLAYRVVVRGESFGPTPTNIPEVCNDPFEQDGLPELARLIFSNETQLGRILCPEGDADWVRFFGVAGRLYVIYTDTRNYAAKTDDPLTFPEPGADTILVLADRDGQRLLDINNDIPGGNSLDSEIQFRPVVDGFYYIQVKNIGDIGSQFIRYDLTVRACPGEYCRPNRPGTTSGSTSPNPTPTFGLLPTISP